MHFDKGYFLIVDRLDYCNYFDVFKYGLLYSKNDFKHWDIFLVKVKRCNLIERKFMTNSANGCGKDMLIFCIFKRLSSLFGLS